jgi:peptidoglycan/LPS O-acetylase OafA/YrhL
MSGTTAPASPAQRTSLALDNLRAWVILLVVAFHASLAYLNFLPAHPFAFASPPFEWRAFPIIDPERSVGLELFCAWQDVFLMTLFFFLSGLFVWPSLQRKGVVLFVSDRMRRIGLPFALIVALLMPVAQYPTYLQGAGQAGVGVYARAFLALPWWPCGPMWFLWLLLGADLIAAGLYAAAPHWRDKISDWSRTAAARPLRYFATLFAAAAFAYVPLALVFSPEAWGQFGPFALQLSRPAHYAVYFFAGAGLGARGLGKGLLAPQAPLTRHWSMWLAAAVGSFALWLGLTALIVGSPGAAGIGLRIADDLCFVLACLCNTFGVLALALRFAAGRRAWLDSLKQNAYGIYLVHYAFVIWLQYALLTAALPAVVKAAVVFCVTAALSWGAAEAWRRLSLAATLRGGARSVAAASG